MTAPANKNRKGNSKVVGDALKDRKGRLSPEGKKVGRFRNTPAGRRLAELKAKADAAESETTSD